MTSPRTPQQLADAIEGLVASYVEDTRRIAQVALEQAFAKSTSTTAASAKTLRTEPSRTGTRRAADELVAVRERLYAVVCARPGESMAVFAEETGLPVRELQRPMSSLKAEGRVRCVGERNLARYFPALGRRSKNSEA